MLDYGFGVRHAGRTYFYIYGGDACMLFVLWMFAVAIARKFSEFSGMGATTVAITVACMYVPTTIICWLMVGLGIVSWT